MPRSIGPVDDLLAPIDQTLIDTRIGTGYGVTMAPHLQELAIAGPMQRHRRVGHAEPAPDLHLPARLAEPGARAAPPTSCGGSRRRPTAARCATTSNDLLHLLRRRRAQRRRRLRGRDPVRHPGHPREPALHVPHRAGAAGRRTACIALTDVDLASRLSFFLWGTLPDEELLKAARRRHAAATPAVFEQAGEADARRSAVARAVDALRGAVAAAAGRRQGAAGRPAVSATGTTSLSEAFVRETELFFDSIVRENRSVLDLITADYTFVNERLARHYGIPNVTGPEFRRVTLPEPRRGLLTQGSMLLLTSVADRTSPVQRGKWVLQVLLGSPPPPPPPNVPALEDTKGAADGRFLSVRERMEQHRSNPACMSCHRVIDPIGLALENFDVVGRYRIKDNGVPVDSTGQLYDGTADGRRRRACAARC